MKKPWIYRDYQSGDESKILTLYKEVNDNEMPLNLWKWRYKRNPFGEGIIKLLFTENKLIGHYAVTPVNLIVDNRPVKSVFSLHTMTHPGFQKQGIFTYLAEEVYKTCQEKDYCFVYGFPNENSYHGFTNKLNWTGFGKMTVLEKNISIHDKKSSSTDGIYEIKRFDHKVDSLWEKTEKSNKIIVPRTKNYLNWRFIEHPTVEYPVYTITDHNSELLGYIILKIYTKEIKAKGHIVDILCAEDENIARRLLHFAYQYFREREIDYLSCWMPKGHFLTRILSEEGFITSEMETQFGVRVFDKEKQFLRFVEHFGKWHLTMGDSDVF